MKNLIIILSTFILNTGCAQTTTKNQDSKFIDFVNSFKEEKSDEILILGRIMFNNKGTQMNKEETLEFVYHTKDTIKLYCNQYIFSNETEEIFGISTELYLPYKYFRINMEKYSFIAYGFYECQHPKEGFKMFMNLCIVDDGFNLRDSIIVSRYNGDTSEIRGLLNPKNGKIFVENRKSTIYIVDENSLTFKVERELNETPSTWDLLKGIKELGLEELFFE